MTATSRRFIGATVYPDDLTGPATSIRADLGTPEVLLNPLFRQGQPTLRGVSTSALAELVAAGEPIEFVADTYGFSVEQVEQVEQAVSFEASKRRAA